MCHGAGGLAAHHRFGARTGLAPVILGALLLGLGLPFADQAGRLLALIPLAAVGALLCSRPPTSRSPGDCSTPGRPAGR